MLYGGGGGYIKLSLIYDFRNILFMSRFIAFMLALTAAGFFIGCDQYAIFYAVSKEEKLKEPKIPGSLTKIVKTGEDPDTDKLYVSNGKIFVCEKGSGDWRWSGFSNPPGGDVRDIAVCGTGSTSILYALTINYSNGDSAIWKYDSGWSRIASDSNLGYQAIYGTDTHLFAALYRGPPSKSGNDYKIVAFNAAGSYQCESSATYFLTGAAHPTGSNYYLSTKGAGIFYYSSIPTASPLPLTDKVTGTADSINALLVYDLVNYKIAASSHEGHIYQISGTTATTSDDKGTLSASGTLALWNNGSAKLLLVGFKVDSYRFGYREMDIDASGNINFSSFRSPSTSVNDNESYIATLEKKALNGLMQAPGPTPAGDFPLVFASTQKDGLWSFRRGGDENRFIWNRED
jgi:hypothetical protein